MVPSAALAKKSQLEKLQAVKLAPSSESAGIVQAVATEGVIIASSLPFSISLIL
jgi:hypothetical protein